MTHWTRVLPLPALAGALLAIACLPGGGSGANPDPTATPRSDVESARTATLSTATPAPSPTQLPVLPVLTSYVVKSGDYPLLIAVNAGVPLAERDAWIAEMLALNGVDATSLQIGQSLILPPYGNGSVPIVRSDSTEAAPPAGVIEPTGPTATSTPEPGNTPAATGGVPFAATPPFVAFTTSTSTPTPTPTATSMPTPAATPTIASGARAWLTSSDEAALYYYCDLDSGWTNIPAEKLQAFDSEQQLIAVWGRYRTRAPDSVC